MKKKVGLVALLIAVAAVGSVYAKDLPMIDAGKDSSSAVKQNLVFGHDVTVVRCTTNDKVKDGFELSYKAKAKPKPNPTGNDKADIMAANSKKLTPEAKYAFEISVFYNDGNKVNFTKSITFTENAAVTTLKIDAKDAAKIRGVAIEVRDTSLVRGSLSDWWSNFWKKKTNDWVDKNFPPLKL